MSSIARVRVALVLENAALVAFGPEPLRVRSEVAVRVKPSERLVLEVEQLCGSGSVELR